MVPVSCCHCNTHAQLQSYIQYSLSHGSKILKFRISRTASGGQYTKTENIAYMCDSIFELDAHMKWLLFLIIELTKGDAHAPPGICTCDNIES